jgi:hypothetical protein
MTVSFVMTPVTCDSASTMHAGLRAPVCFQQVPRAQLHPACIKGNALVLTPCTQRSQHNRLSYCALSRYLAQHALLLVLKVYCAESHCSQFWCLIPPEVPLDPSLAATGGDGDITLGAGAMCLLQLQDSEGMVNYTAIATPAAVTAAASSTPVSSTVRGSSELDQDSLELLQFMERTIHSSLNAGASAGSYLDSQSSSSSTTTAGISAAFFNPLFAESHSITSAVSMQSLLYTHCDKTHNHALLLTLCCR